MLTRVKSARTSGSRPSTRSACKPQALNRFGGLPRAKLSKIELRILEARWTCGKASIRDIHGLFPEPRPAYTTVQTIVYRMEAKRAVRRVERAR